MNKIKEFLVKFLLVEEIAVALFLTVVMMYFLGGRYSGDYLIEVLLFIAFFVLIRTGIKSFSKRRLKYSLWFTIPLSIAFWFGHKVIEQSVEIKGIKPWDFPVIIALIIIFTLMSIVVLSFLDRKQSYLKKIPIFKRKKWLKYSLIIFVCWLPLFLAFFPGLVSSDNAVQISQAIGESSWSNWHPVVSTAFIALPTTIGFNLFGDLTAGIALATLTQMIVLSLIFGYVTEWIMSRVSKKWVGYVFLAFFALCPVIASYSIILWKDVMFSALFMLLVLKIYELVSSTGREQQLCIKSIVWIFVLAVLVAFFRNGGILILVTFSIVMLIYFRRTRKALAVASIISISLLLIIQGPIYKALNIFSSPFMESMSVTAQQIGYVVLKDGVSEEEKAALNKYVDVDKLRVSYTPMDADPAKNSFNYDVVEEDKIGFLNVWLKIMKNHFGAYVYSYILHTYSYWYPGKTETWAIDFEHDHNSTWMQQEYTDLSLIGEQPASMIKSIELWLMSSYWSGWMTNVGIMCWGVIFMLAVFLYQKKYYMIVPVSLILVYIISLLIASPVSWIFRYVYSLLLILPLLALFSFVKLRKKENK